MPLILEIKPLTEIESMKRFAQHRSLLRMTILLPVLALIPLVAVAVPAAAQPDVSTGNVIFLHPDGAGVNSWCALRMWTAGPDGEIAWDRIPYLGIYRGHMLDGLTSTSHGGATVHAYGVKVPADSYGMHGQNPLKALSGYDGSIMEEALARGKAVGIVNSGHIGEPGTGVFLASVPRRSDEAGIAAQVLASGAHVILVGGEQYLLPDGVRGFHGEGDREDGRNLIEEAEAAGYTVVYNREQLLAVDTSNTDKLLGLFARKHTFNAISQEDILRSGYPHYWEIAPTFAEMVEVALAILSRHEEGFLLVAEEKGSDNFGNANNAAGTLEALRRADEGYAVALDFLSINPDTLLVTAADSDAGGIQVISPGQSTGHYFSATDPVPSPLENGAAHHGRNGVGTEPFLAAPDKNGNRYTFGISWADTGDTAGGIAARAAGLHANRLPLNTDNTDIYRLMYLTLFGEDLGLPQANHRPSMAAD